jgi:hypothetical protein
VRVELHKQKDCDQKRGIQHYTARKWKYNKKNCHISEWTWGYSIFKLGNVNLLTTLNVDPWLSDASQTNQPGLVDPWFIFLVPKVWISRILAMDIKPRILTKNINKITYSKWFWQRTCHVKTSCLCSDKHLQTPLQQGRRTNQTAQSTESLEIKTLEIYQHHGDIMGIILGRYHGDIKKRGQRDWLFVPWRSNSSPKSREFPWWGSKLEEFPESPENDARYSNSGR